MGNQKALQITGGDYLLAGDDYLLPLFGFENAVSINKQRDRTMKIKRTAVITTLSVLIGLGIVGVSPAFAGNWGNNFGASSMTSYLNE